MSEWMVVDWSKSENGPQRRRASNGRALHCCCICNKLGTWGTTWAFYGSLKDEDDGELLPKFCSAGCQKAGGEKASKVSEEMKAKAREHEKRPPTLVYREMTEREKFRAAVSDQRRANPAL